MACKHAALAAIYAQQMAEMDEPWKLWEWKNEKADGYLPCDRHFPFFDHNDYRQIPKTIGIGKYDVPEPMREKPEIGSKYWYIDIDNLCEWTTWQDDEWDNHRFKLGICHSTHDNCLIHAKALFSFSEVG